MPMNEGQGARMEVALILVSPLSCLLLAVTWTVVRLRRCECDDALQEVAVGALTPRSRLRKVPRGRGIALMLEEVRLIRRWFGR